MNLLFVVLIYNINLFTFFILGIFLIYIYKINTRSFLRLNVEKFQF